MRCLYAVYEITTEGRRPACSWPLCGSKSIQIISPCFGACASESFCPGLARLAILCYLVNCPKKHQLQQANFQV